MMEQPNLWEWAARYGPARVRRNVLRSNPLARQVRNRLSRGVCALDGDQEVELLVEMWAMGMIPASLCQCIGAAACAAALDQRCKF